ncbi:uncharacterized protein LOC133741226 [Rosa rugosa]|uniref:uncharacterized protein LOC133741226 n=1 Tax=Rosa rugosa TaxID=74645 RepID=UPI002B400BDE|nr:uncharacterized protein LOC133741226 [Rosa rugosa]
MPKFGEWDVSDPASAEGFTVIFNKLARTEEKTGGRPESPAEDDCTYKHGAVLGKPTIVNNTGVVGCILNPETFRAVLNKTFCVSSTQERRRSRSTGLKFHHQTTSYRKNV